MRTTLTLDEDVAQETRRLARKLQRPFKCTLNEVLRAGLKTVGRPLRQRPYRTKGRPMSERTGLNLDNIHEVLSQIEQENYK